MKEEIAEKLLEEIICTEFPFYLWESETNEDGSYTKLYTPRAQGIYNRIISLLEKYEIK